MSTPIDVLILELLAGCEQLAAEATSRAVRVVSQLTEAQLESRSVSATVLKTYQEQAEHASKDLERFRQLVARFKSQIRVH